MGYVQQRRIPSRAEIVVGMVGDAIRRVCDRREFARFVDQCPGEADRLARDLNIDKASLQKLAGFGNSRPVLLNRRLRHLGFDPDKLYFSRPAVAQDLARCCALCGSKSRCAKDLDRRPNSADWRNYCPNGQTLAALGPATSA